MDTTVGCVPVTSECLCSNSNFLYGIRDCAVSACTDAADATAAYSYASASCAAVLSPTTSNVPTTTSTTPISEASTTTTADADTVSTSPATSSTVVNGIAGSTSSSPESSEAATTTASAAATSAVSASATSDVSAATSTASGMTIAYISATTGSSAATSGGAAAAAASSSSASGSSSDSTENEVNLSTGAKIGIVVASASGAVAIVGIIMYLSRRRSQPLPRGKLKISEPMPGSGRIGDEEWEHYHKPNPAYAPQSQRQVSPPPGTAGSNMAELQRHARPYEEMVPRVTPARMV
ncbi:hypothetical protein BD289DRAFT_223433 [Coniella lustricola]|uniref:CFEM domain-containing protein n=1 Tax=Coniella lustricola TaxID=2025994 RepID=A0A2T3AAW2_9PEZI|nr:hypothetical protein BD289DRAFT_223433 [Coniella lustricola]